MQAKKSVKVSRIRKVLIAVCGLCTAIAVFRGCMTQQQADNVEQSVEAIIDVAEEFETVNGVET